MTRTLSLTSGAPRQERFGRLKAIFRHIDITSYTTGGESITASEVGLLQIVGMLPISTENGYAFQWDKTANTIKAFGTGTASTGILIEEGAATDVGELDVLFLGY